MTPRNSLVFPEGIEPAKVFIVLSQYCQGTGAMRHGGVSVGDFRGPSRTAIFNEGPSRMKRMLLGASAVIALSAGHAVRADDDYHFHVGNKNPAISYVRNSLAQSVILNGPWTLHESVANFIHDASGIVPPATQTAPPYTGTGTPYASYCNVSGAATPPRNFSPDRRHFSPDLKERMG